MTKHEHCAHVSLKFCEHCDVTYCLDCKKEWGVGSTYQPYTTTTISDPIPTAPYAFSYIKGVTDFTHPHA